MIFLSPPPKQVIKQVRKKSHKSFFFLSQRQKAFNINSFCLWFPFFSPEEVNGSPKVDGNHKIHHINLNFLGVN